MALSTTLLSQVQVSRETGSALLDDGPESAVRVADMLQPFVEEGESVPDLAGLMPLVGRRLERLTRAVLEARLTCEQERATLSRARAGRDLNAAKLSKAMTTTKTCSRSLYDLHQVEGFGFPHPMPTRTDDLARAGRTLIDRLEEPGFTFPEPDIDMPAPNPAKVVAIFKPLVGNLEKSLIHVAWQQKRVQTALDAKTRLSHTFKVELDRVVKWLRATLELAGMELEAKRLESPGVRAKKLFARLEQDRAEAGES